MTVRNVIRYAHFVLAVMQVIVAVLSALENALAPLA